VFLFLKAKLYKDVDFKTVDKAQIASMMKYSVPMIPTTVFWWITNVSDRYMVSYMVGHDVNGLYSAAYKIPTLLTLICMVFIEAWQFSAVSESDEKERADFFTEVFAAYQGLMFMAASALVLFAKVATLILLDKSYYDSWQYIPPLALAMVFSGLVTFMGSVYLVKKKSVMSFVTAMIGAVVNVALNVLLIPVLSAMGAAIATFVSYFVVMIIRSVNTQKYVRFNMGIPKLVFNTAVLAAQSVVMVFEIKYWIAVEAVLFAAIVAVNGKDMLKGILSALKNIGKKQKNI
jgi:O-antigen/teichoic acid export membrane protein